MLRNPIENVSRRAVLLGLGLTAGLLLAVTPAARRGLATDATSADKLPHGTVNDPRAFVSIAPDGIVTIIAARAEMGTGVRTSLPMVVADEMGADWSRVRVRQAPGDEEKYGNQDTDGSRSTRHFLIPMRQVGAAARMMLEAAAAQRWNVAVTEVKAVNHEVVHTGTGQTLGYGDLAADAAALQVPDVATLRLKDPKDFRYIGKGRVGLVDLHNITTGKAMFGIDT